jgi:hypothetical protein
MNALTDATRSKVLHWLSIVNPNTHPDDGYLMSDIDSAARFVLHGTSGDLPRPVDLTPGQVTVKTEDLSALVTSLAKTLMAQAVSSGTMSQPTSGTNQQPAQPNNSARRYSCHYCDNAQHGIGECPQVDEDTKKGLVKRNAEGKVTLPTGAFVPRNTPGNNMQERVTEWHKRNPGNVAVGTMSYAIDPSNPTSSMMFSIASDDPTSVFTLSDDDRIAAVERELFQLKAKKARLKGVFVPQRTRRAPTPATQPGPSSENVPINPALAPQPANLPPTPAPASTAQQPPAAPRVTIKELPEHPFAAVPDATYRPLTQRNIGAPPAKPKDEAKRPAYKTVAPIENPKTVEAVLERSLKGSSVTLSHEELLSISPKIRNKLRDLLTPKRVADKQDAAVLLNAHINPTLPLVEELIKSDEELPRGVLRIPDPFETYLSRLPPGAERPTLMVAKESHAL